MYSFALCYVEEKTCCGCAIALFLQSCTGMLLLCRCTVPAVLYQSAAVVLLLCSCNPVPVCCCAVALFLRSCAGMLLCRCTFPAGLLFRVQLQTLAALLNNLLYARGIL